MDFLLAAFVSFSALVFAFLTVIDAVSYRDMQGNGSSSHIYSHSNRRNFMGKALVIVPAKGKDISLYGNLKSLASQDIKNYKLIAVVDSENDPALKEIKKAGVEYLISGADCAKCSGKVRAIATAVEAYRNFDVYVIADSDITAKKNWLRKLLEPFSERAVGISTTFPEFYPVRGFWSDVKHVWGFVGNSLMENKRTVFGWGGSLAFRKGILDKKGMKFFKNSKYSVSDDIPITKLARKRNMKIVYVPEAAPIVKCRENIHTFFEWATRQSALSFLSSRRQALYGMGFYGAEVFNFISGIVLTVLVSPVFLIFFLHSAIRMSRSYKRSNVKRMRTLLIAGIMPFLFLENVIAASFLKEITWRGTVYRIKKGRLN